jgi:hypothetical protein
MNANNVQPNFKLILLNVYAMASLGIIKLLDLASSSEEEETWCEMMVLTSIGSSFLFGCIPFLFYTMDQLLLLIKIIATLNVAFLTIGLLFYRLSK